MAILYYPTILSPFAADILFPTDEDLNSLPADQAAYDLAASAILACTGWPAALPITIKTHNLNEPTPQVVIAGYGEVMVAATATDRGGRVVHFLVWG